MMKVGDSTDDALDSFSKSSRDLMVAESNSRVQPQILTFESMNASVKVFGQMTPVVIEASGHCLAGETMAIMGPSGAGKSSLLDLLTMRKTIGTWSGDLKLDGYKITKEELVAISGYVTSDDVQVPELTAKETLFFAAHLRLPIHWTSERRAERVREILEQMKLTKVQDNYVGSPLIRGLSTGERKRLNIAIELIPSPIVLFMDEPTSGLDSTIGREIVRDIVQLGRSHKMITIMSIHQPSYQILEQFDSLFLLAKGQMCYFGPTKHAIAFFAEQGHVSDSNPAETYADALSTNYESIIKAYPNSQVKQKMDEVRESTLKSVQTSPDVYKINRSKEEYATHILIEIRELFVRFVRLYIRNSTMIWSRGALAILLGILLGLVFLQRDYSQGGYVTRYLMIFALSQNPLLVAIASIPLYIHQRKLYYHEVVSGFYTSFVYHCIFFLVEFAVVTAIILLVNLIAWGMASMNPASFGLLIGLTIVLCLCGVATAQFAAAVNSTVPGASAFTLFMTLWNLVFSGYLIQDAYLDPLCHACQVFFKWTSQTRGFFMPLVIHEFVGFPFNCTAEEAIELQINDLVQEGLTAAQSTIQSIIANADPSGALLALNATNTTLFNEAITSITSLSTNQYFANILYNDVVLNPALANVTYAPVVAGIALSDYFYGSIGQSIAGVNYTQYLNATALAYLYNMSFAYYAASTVLNAQAEGTFYLPTVSTCLYANGTVFTQQYAGFTIDEYTDGYYGGVIFGLACMFFVLAYVALKFCRYQKR